MLARRCFRVSIVVLMLGLAVAARAGMVIEVTDPRYFEQHHDVIFPNAQVKLVAFEFESVAGDERGKLRAKQFHDQFLAGIHDVSGGAILTYVTPPGARIEDYRVRAEQVAADQHAQLALWGRIFTDASGRSLINARLTLVEPPPGIGSRCPWLGARSETPVRVRGWLDAPVATTRIDFNTLEDDIDPVVSFLTGLARYYKGAAPTDPESARWLRDAVADFERYVAAVPVESDAAALAEAHLYLARAHVRLAGAEPAAKDSHFAAAALHLEQAASLNPYDASVPGSQAVLAAARGGDPDATAKDLRARLTAAVTLAPADSTARLNLAVLDASEARFGEAVRGLEQANFAEKVRRGTPLEAAESMQRQIESEGLDRAEHH